MQQTKDPKKSVLVWRIDLRSTMKCMRVGTYVEIPRGEISSQAVTMACKALNENRRSEAYRWHWGVSERGQRVYRIERRI